MCGIVGRVNAAPERRVLADELRAATRVIAHRGPDGEGLYCEGPVGLGHRRLSIVDVAAGAQPMSTPDDRITVVFNGEIYNHGDLRKELRARGYEFRTHSDTEVLVHGYDAWGEGLPSKLRGMFAFAIWDARRQRLFVARDRVGIKPLYFARLANGDLVFGSEVKALFAFPDVERAIDDSAVPSFLALRYVPAPQTMFRGVRRLEPGHVLTFEPRNGGELRQEQYWDIPVSALDGASSRKFDVVEEADRLQQLLRETVSMHLMGEVPVGLFLSGGIDSTSIGWAMREAGAERLRSFAVGFDEDSEDELAWARMAAQSIGAEHREVKVSARLFRDSMHELVFHLDEPNADGACIPLMHLARRAREEVTVVLSGEGADELYGGYGIYRKLLAIDRAQAWGGNTVRGAAAASQKLFASPRVRKYLRMLERPLVEHYFGVGRAFCDELLLETFGDRAVQSLTEKFAPLWAKTEGAPALNRLLYNDTKIWLPDDLLIKADKMTMSSAVELRVPFLDHVVLENAWRVPPELKLRGGVGKYLLRRAMRGRIPDAILDRPKKGFPVPIGRWLRTSLFGPCQDRLLASDSYVRGLFGAGALKGLLEQHRSGAANRTEELYALWVLEEWHRAWLSPHRFQSVRNVMKPATVELFDAPQTPTPDMGAKRAPEGEGAKSSNELATSSTTNAT